MKKAVIAALVIGTSIPLLHAVSIRQLLSQGKIPAMVSVKHALPERSLVTLDLSDKKIDSLDGLLEIQNIREAQRINLDFNLLTDIPEGSFKGLNKLQELNLNYNQLTSINPVAIVILYSLRDLFLNSNPLSCSDVVLLEMHLKGRANVICT